MSVSIWEKCLQWAVGDIRLSEAKTPPDIFALDALIREKIKKVAEGLQNNVLYDRMLSEENAWWAVTKRILPARKFMAMSFENFRISNVEVKKMYMQGFPTLIMRPTVIEMQINGGRHSSVEQPRCLVL